MNIRTTARRIGRHRSATPAELRAENVALLNRQAAADDYFALLMHDRAEVYEAWEAAVRRAADAETVVVCQQADIEELTAEVTRLRAELANTMRVDVPLMERDTTDGADQATAPIDARELRERFAAGPVVTLHHAPQATTPVHVPVLAT
ncbi:hypothetical protein [Streptomyces sp. NPDC059783]|uniref:hypothetical protein n=1 Tax=Streptomyces sp. NPDC059783 TaxID=3346944 RepID=UPI00364E05B6